MKKIILLAVLLLSTILLYSQPQKISYQAIIRDANGNVLQNQNVTLQLDILQGSSTGSVIYSETQTTTTNQYGLINIFIGDGIPTQGVFSDIDWSNGPYFLKTSVDIGNGPEELGTQELVSVPYSLYSQSAKYADSISAVGNSGELQFNNNGNLDASPNLYWDITKERLGIGTSSPQGRVVIQQDPLAPDSLPLFEVKDKNGDPVFVVYPDSVHVFLSNDSTKAIGSRGGFAVSGRVNMKGTENRYLYVTADSTRIWTSGAASGFGVLDLSSGTETGYMHITPDNYFIGEHSGDSVTTGSHNSTFGYESGRNIKSAYENVFIGHKAGYSVTGGYDNNFIGVEAGYSNTSGTYNNFVGHFAGNSNKTGRFNNFMGDQAGMRNTSGESNVYIGDNAGMSDTSGSCNVCIGKNTGMNMISASNNNFIGYESGYLNTTGHENNFIGYQAGYSNTTGQYNDFMGNQAGYSNTTGQYNDFIGYKAGYSNTTSSYNVSIGYEAGMNNDYIHNVFIGSEAGLSNTNGRGNVLVGMSAGHDNTNGSHNTFIGPAAGYHSSGSNCIFIGWGAGDQETGDNKLYIDNSSSSTPLIYGEFDNKIVDINGNFGIKEKAPHEPLEVSGTGRAFFGDGGGDNRKGLLIDGNETFGTRIESYDYGSGTGMNLIINSAGHGKVGINTTSPTHLLTINASTDSLALRLIGPNGSFGYGAMLNFGDGNNAYIQEFTDDKLKIHASSGVVLETVYGNIGINTDSPDKLLTVNGDARVTGDIYYGAIGSSTTYSKPDFVFKPNYDKDFRIDYIERFIKKHGHLPWITAAKDEKNGINMTRMSFQTLEAVENIQMQVIALRKENLSLKKENQELLKRIEKIEKQLKNK